MYEEELKELGIEDADMLSKLGKFVQSKEDKLRTEKSNEIKTLQTEVEKYKPREKTEQEIEYESLKAELKGLKFKASLKEKGVAESLADYLKSDIDIDAFSETMKGLQVATNKDFVPSGHDKNLGITKEQFQKMGYTEKARLYSEDPELYAQLSK